MDALDHAIIEELTKNARLTNQELAEKVGLTAAPCLRRVRRLEEEGVIEGYTTRLNHNVLGNGFEVVVNMELVGNEIRRVESLEKELTAMPEVVELRRMFGQPDYTMRVRVKDSAAYEEWVSKYLVPHPDIARIDSRITMKVIK
ncbi:Lrp/AsnC family transcriptional regulator [Rothia aerolata]|uniref:Transcriptional regulator, AsnC family protein n=1 Tax=Rothia aerolata TaxID=1812262 RepID=A0A917IQV4_9MICC|nr:Lrp/AsnC family transcriptional regulator [Rothia aerolata]GGH60015.1 putative transcriptional regulator, AsnC family protein [Rothia aerolata]